MADERVEIEKITPEEEAPLLRPGYPRAIGSADSASYGYSYSAEEGGHNLRSIWRIVRKRKWLIISIALIVTTIVTVDVYRTKSTYQATATVEIGKESSGLVRTGDLVIQDDSDTFVPVVGIKTKMLALKSRPLLEEVVINLKLDQNPQFLDVTHKKSVWDAIKTIVGKDSEQDQEELPEVAKAPTEVKPNEKLIQSPETSKRLAPYVGVLGTNMKVEQIRDTRALSISYTHTDPVIAAEVANGIANVFIDNSFRNKTEKFTNTSEWLDDATRKLKARVEQAEQALANYTRDKGIFSTDGKETLTTDKLSRLHEQATRAETERIIKHSLYEQVKAGRIVQLPEAFADSRTAELQKKLGELTVEAAKLDLKFGPENPKVKSVKQEMTVLQEQVEASRKTLEERLKADYERAVRDEQSLKAALDRAKGEAVQQNQAAIQYNILKQEVDTNKALYTDFLQKANQARVQLAEQQKNVRLIEPAEAPGGPIGPKRMRTILIALFLSFGAGIGIAFFLDYLDNTVKTVEDVNRYAQLPALSVIPALAANAPRKLSAKNGRKAIVSNGSSQAAHVSGSQSSSLVALDNRSSAAEAYRVLRTSVLLSSAGNPPKMILVTSGQPGEGKTTTVVNTAISLAQLGASVLIIDCDLRKPATHKIFGVDHVRGLSTYLSRDVGIDELIHKLQIPNLSLLPCGPIPPNPAELISSEKMKSMLRTLAERYEHILIDSPPLINVTDPVILSTMVDGVILVVHGGKSTRDVVRRARQELTSVGAKIFGVVLNNVDLRREGYDNYYYYRYYSNYGQDGAEAR